MWNGVGGGTVVYAAQWQRNMPSDFRVKTLDGIADDWPLTYEDLEPYYVRVERDFGISGLANDTAFPPGEGPPLPPVPLGPAGRRVAKAHNELGWHWWPAPNAIATRDYGGLHACQQVGTCLQACAYGAKGTADLTHWPKAIELGVELRTGARVRELIVRPDGLVAGASYVDRGRQRARGPRRRDDPGGERRRHAAAAAAVGRLARRAGELFRPRRQAADDASLRDRRRRLRRGLPRVAGALGPVHPLARVLRDRRVARVRPRRQVGAAADRRAVLDDERLSVGRRERDLGSGLPGRRPRPARPLDHVGHHRRGPARGVQPGRRRPRSTATRTASRARRSNTSCRRTRGGSSSSTRRARRSRCSRRARAMWSSLRSSARPAGTCWAPP